MRLQLIAGLVAAGVAHAEDGVQARVDVYHDPWITVVIPATGATVDRGDATVSGSVTLDFVSGATPALQADAVSSATWFGDRRVAGELSSTWHPQTTWSAGAHVGASTERDFSAVSGGASATFDAFDRRATVASSLTVGRETAWASTGGPKAASVTAQVDASVTAVVDRDTLLAVLGTGRVEQCAEALGCQASPYRYVPFVDGGVPVLALPERHPDERWRGAVALRLSRAFGDWTAAHVGWRLYGDSWGVLGHTADLSVARQLFDEHLLVRAEARYAAQGPARFWRDTYRTSLEDPAFVPWRTADGELSGLRELVVEGRGAWTFFEVGAASALTVDVRAAGMWFWYPRWTERPRRPAVLLGGGLGAAF